MILIKHFSIPKKIEVKKRFLVTKKSQYTSLEYK